MLRKGERRENFMTCQAARVFFFFFVCYVSSLRAHGGATATNGEWSTVTATASFYQETPAGLNSRACGYGDLFGRSVAAVSGVLFDRGSACGRCYEVRCVDHVLWCRPGSPSVVVTAGDFCPPNYGLSADSGGWCNFPSEHFQLPSASFFSIAEKTADLVPVQHRRVECERRGGVRFTLSGSPKGAFFQVLIWNVAADGDIAAVKVKGSRTGWIPMARNWGQNWHAAAFLAGQQLSFELTGGGGETLIFYNVASADWTLGQTFEAKNQFH